MPTAVRRLCGQESTGPIGVAAQSCARTSAPISPPPARNAGSDVRPRSMNAAPRLTLRARCRPGPRHRDAEPLDVARDPVRGPNAVDARRAAVEHDGGDRAAARRADEALVRGADLGAV